MGVEFKVQASHLINVLTPAGQEIIHHDEGAMSVITENERTATRTLEDYLKTRKEVISQLSENCTRGILADGARIEAFHLHLDRNNRLNKENGRYHLVIKHTGKDTRTNSVLIQNDLNLTLSGFPAATADHLVNTAISRAEQLTNTIMSQLTLQ